MTPLCAHCVDRPATTTWRKYRVCRACQDGLSRNAAADRTMRGGVAWFLREQRQPVPVSLPPVRVVKEFPAQSLHYQPPEPRRDLCTDLLQLHRQNRKRGSF